MHIQKRRPEALGSYVISNSIHRLTFDIFIDHIFVFLCVEDVLSLRRVNKAFFLLTHEPIVWNRFMAQIHFPVPPVQTTSRNDLRDTCFQTEQLVSCAISLEKKWRKQRPSATSMIFDSLHRVVDMKLLPGGKYLVASVQDGPHFFIVIYCLTHSSGPSALTRVPTKAKATKLQARYTMYRGKPVVMIAYVQKRPAKSEHTKDDASMNERKQTSDSRLPSVNELVCVKIDLSVLDLLSDPDPSADGFEPSRLPTEPFTQVASTMGQRHIESVSLYDLGNKPHVMIVQSPDRIVSINLTTQTKSRIICASQHVFERQLHSIRAVRPLPAQNEVLVFRTIEEPASDVNRELPNYVHFLEIYDHPTTIASRSTNPKDMHIISFEDVTTAHISDDTIPTANGDSQFPPFHAVPSPHLSVYIETKNPSGIVHEILWPSCKVNKQGDKTYFYNLDHVCFQTHHDSHPRVAHVLPGAHRAFVYTTTDSNRKDAHTLTSLRRYISPEIHRKGYPYYLRADRSCDIMRSHPPTAPVSAYGIIEGCSSAIKHYQKNRMGAITWDDNIGRVCIADGKTTHIEVVDFAKVIDIDERFEQWKMVKKSVKRDSLIAKYGLPILSILLILVPYFLDTATV